LVGFDGTGGPLFFALDSYFWFHSQARPVDRAINPDLSNFSSLRAENERGI
jgi:hypothetical protein